MRTASAVAPKRALANRLARTRSASRDLSIALGIGGALFIALGVSSSSPLVLALASALLSGSLMCADVSRARRGGVTPITLYSLVSGAGALANATGLLEANTSNRGEYFFYAVDDYLTTAMWLSMAGSILPVLGFYAATRTRQGRGLCALLPAIRAEISDARLVRFGLFCGVGASLMRAVLLRPPFGTLTTVVIMMPHMMIFALSRAGAARRVPGATKASLLITVLETGRSLAQDYLRGDIVSASIAFALGTLIGARSFAPLRTRLFAPVYVVAALFTIYFSEFGLVRSVSGGGLERIDAVLAAQEMDQSSAIAQQSVWSRLTNFNQLTQVVRIAREDGFLNGLTLEYLGFVFIPRFLWEDKPLVAKGGWFAWRIGQAYQRPDGQFSNSVNMTVPGELYLNFDWAGVIAGCLIFGALIGVLWSRALFWAAPQNVLGGAFGYFLFWVTLTLGADLQILVSMVATYLVFAAISVAQRLYSPLNPRLSVPGASLSGVR